MGSNSGKALHGWKVVHLKSLPLFLRVTAQEKEKGQSDIRWMLQRQSALSCRVLTLNNTDCHDADYNSEYISYLFDRFILFQRFQTHTSPKDS